MNAARIERITALLAPLAPLRCEVRDDSHLHAGHPGAASGGGHFHLTLVSADFDGLRSVARHRKVYALLQPLFPDVIHALSMTLLSPQEDTAV